MTKNVFATIVGKPNVGKSSILNALVGEKIAAVSNKPQTTRTRITGILTKDEIQYVFIDTPGIHNARNKLSVHMNAAIKDTLNSGDVIIYVADCTQPITEEEKDFIKYFKGTKSKVMLIVNKMDLPSNKTVIIETINDYMAVYDFYEVMPISVKEDDGLDFIMDVLEHTAVEGPHFFPDDKVTDQPEKVIMSEIIREKALLFLKHEVPHGIAVTIESLEERVDSIGEDILDIEATIYCERESHKGIIIGKNGIMLKVIASEAREDLENFFRIKVNLKCWVKVKEGWRNREGMIKNFGLD